MKKLFEELKEENKLLATEISKAEAQEDYDSQKILKRKFYQNKINMIDLIDAKTQKNSTSAKELINKVKAMKPAIRYETGLHYLDEKLKGGFEVGSLILLGGQSGAGKSHMTLDILKNISKYAKTMFFNFEMGERRLVDRLKRLLSTKEQLDNFQINSDSRDLEDLIMEIKLSADDGVVFFVIDSKMKITVRGDAQEYQKISSISKRLSEVAIKHDIIIFLINQISEDDLKTKRLSFKGSGDQLYDADIALFLLIDADGTTRKLICSKNRQDEYLWETALPQPIDYNNISYQEIEYKAEPLSMPILQGE